MNAVMKDLLKAASLDNAVSLNADEAKIDIYEFVMNSMAVMLKFNVVNMNVILAEIVAENFDIGIDAAKVIVDCANELYVEAYSK